jgi:hypothetical protein
LVSTVAGSPSVSPIRAGARKAVASAAAASAAIVPSNQRSTVNRPTRCLINMPTPAKKKGMQRR